MNRPRWRWWLFCAALWLGWRTHWQWEWVSRVYSWSVLPEWLATPEEIEASRAGPWPKTWGDSPEVSRG